MLEKGTIVKQKAQFKRSVLQVVVITSSMQSVILKDKFKRCISYSKWYSVALPANHRVAGTYVSN